MTETNVTTYEVLAERLDYLKEELAKVNRKAAKHGFDTVTLTVGERIETEMYFCYDQTGAKVRCVYDPNRSMPKNAVRYTEVRYACHIDLPVVGLDGWELIATIAPQENGEVLVRCVPGKECPRYYRENVLTCDHCQTSRRRNEVFIVYHNATNEYKRVGRNCIHDFLGINAERFLSLATFVQSVVDTFSDYDDEAFYGSGLYAVQTTEYLPLVACVIRRDGWVSRTTAKDLMSASTSDIAWNLSIPTSYNRKLREEYEPSEADSELAAKALAWARELPTNEGDYIYNLGVASRQECVNHRTIGLVASAIVAYKRHVEKQVAKPTVKASEYQGSIKERRIFNNLTVQGTNEFPSMYGVTTLIRMKDEQGNVIVWFCTGNAPEGMETGSVISIKATIKAHEQYKGTKQTVVNRAVIV